MQKKHLLYLGAMALALLVAGSVYAAGPGGFGPGSRPMGVPGQRTAQGLMISGTITAISGTTISLSGRQGFGPNSATTTFSIDASNAKFSKFVQISTGRPTSTAISLSDLQVGNSVTVRGQISGTNITATQIIIGQYGRGMGGYGAGQEPTGNNPTRYGRPGTSTPPNMAPLNRLSGTISAIQNYIITLNSQMMPGRDNKASGTSYTVDASNAKISSGFGPNQTALTLSDLSVGDMIEASGTISGTEMTASAIAKITRPNISSSTPRMSKPANQTPDKNASSTRVAEVRNALAKIFGKIKNLFHHIFK